MEPGGRCLAVIVAQEIWRRNVVGAWSQIGKAEISLQSLASLDGVVFAGGMNEAALLRVRGSGELECLKSFDATPGREEWFAGGPPLGVRSLAVTSNGAALLIGVHVGGIPRSVDWGASRTPSIPVMFDVREVRAHPSLPGFVAAACAVGLCLSDDCGVTWSALSSGLDATTSLAVAVLEDEVLISIQDGPFASRSQIWRWRNGTEQIDPVRGGLPEWLDGKVDTEHIAAGAGRTAVVDGGGNLWLSRASSTGCQRIAGELGYVLG